MIAEAIKEVLALAPIQHIAIDGQEYVKQDQGIIRLKKPDETIPKVLTFTTLGGLAEYVDANPDALEMDRLFLHVAGFNRVELVGPLQQANDNCRFVYAIATAEDTAGNFKFGQWLDLEDLIIRLQTDFARYHGIEDDTEAMIEMLGKVANEKLQTNTDNGFSQTIQVRSGLTTLSSVKVENPVRVRPWRTFAEIEQPEVLAVLRFRPTGDGKPTGALFESGGGTWKLLAIKHIAKWLHDTVDGIDILM
jgi:hypothetical protein